MCIEQACSTVVYKCVRLKKQRNWEFHSKSGECKTRESKEGIGITTTGVGAAFSQAQMGKDGCPASKERLSFVSGQSFYK